MGRMLIIKFPTAIKVFENDENANNIVNFEIVLMLFLI